MDREGQVNLRSTTPFLRWPGGKRWLMPMIATLISGIQFRRYYEPFLGGGACFFSLTPPISFLSDLNADLINTYIQVREDAQAIIARLRTMNVDLESYRRVRCASPECDVERAVRFLYLNRTAFSGIYRVNRRGEFNVPFGGGGRTPASLWNNGLLVNSSACLRNAYILVSDFEDALDSAGEGDLIYCDPIYTVNHNDNGFKRYNEKAFSWRDQERLAKVCRGCVERGAAVLVSNAYHEEVRKLYSGFESHIVSRQSRLCPQASMRRSTAEYLFVGKRT